MSVAAEGVGRMLNGAIIAKEINEPEAYSRLTGEHVKQLLERGLTHTTISAAGLWSADAGESSNLVGFPVRSGALVLPYRNPLTEQVVLNRIRPDIPPVFNGKPARYLSPRGTGNRVYFFPDCADFLHDPSVPLIVTEGEFKTLWAYQVGLFCLGFAGVYGFLSKNEYGETRPVSDLDLIAWSRRKVTIVYDSDTATNAKVRKAREDLARELYRRGVQSVYAINLPSLE